jgi:hypothetical protein
MVKTSFWVRYYCFGNDGWVWGLLNALGQHAADELLKFLMDDGMKN